MVYEDVTGLSVLFEAHTCNSSQDQRPQQQHYISTNW